MKKRLLALFLVLLMTAPLTACSKADSETSDPSSDVQTPDAVSEEADAETVPPETDDLPEKDYAGADVLIYSEGYLTNDYHNFYNIYEETGSVVSDAAYQRNRTIEERFNVKLGYTDSVPNGDMSI